MHVYVITNTANGKLYVGQHSTDDLDWYFRETIASAMRGSTGKRLLYRAIRKHTPDKFNIRSIYKATDKADMDRAEIAYIKFFGTRDPNLGYNLTDGGDGVTGYIATEETREKLRQATLARGGISQKCRDAQKEYITNRVFTEEHLEKIAAAHRGTKRTSEQRATMSASHKGKKQNLSPEQRQALSDKKKAWWSERKGTPVATHIFERVQAGRDAAHALRKKQETANAA